VAIFGRFYLISRTFFHTGKNMPTDGKTIQERSCLRKNASAGKSLEDWSCGPRGAAFGFEAIEFASNLKSRRAGRYSRSGGPPPEGDLLPVLTPLRDAPRWGFQTLS
jgi:hypothetical protein